MTNLQLDKLNPPTDDTAMDPRIARSRAKVIDAARELLVERGPRGVTVDAVSERSGVSKSTLYRHWSSRTELLTELVRSCMPQMSAPDRADGFVACLHAYVDQVTDALADDSYALAIGSMVTLRRQMPEIEPAVAAERANKLAILDEILEAGRAEGLVDDDLVADRLATLVLGPIFFEATFGRDPNVSAADQAAHLRDLASDVVDRFLASLGN